MEYADQQNEIDNDYRSNPGSNDGDSREQQESKFGGLTLEIDIEETDDFPEHGLRLATNNETTPEQRIIEPEVPDTPTYEFNIDKEF
jgi:hypothetical protein